MPRAEILMAELPRSGSAVVPCPNRDRAERAEWDPPRRLVDRLHARRDACAFRRPGRDDFPSAIFIGDAVSGRSHQLPQFRDIRREEVGNVTSTAWWVVVACVLTVR